MLDSQHSDGEELGFGIGVYLSEVTDPRVARCRLHSLEELFTIIICAVVAGADNWVAIETFAKARLQWFSRFLSLPNGVPSHDTLGRVFATLETEQLTQAFAKWMASVERITDGEIVAIDGKTLRRSFDTASGKAAIHMVSAFAATNGVVLGQLKTAEKSNEITAIPKLLELLSIKGCIVTIDAMGCQRDIANKIVERGGDYVLRVKGNQPALQQDIMALFAWGEQSQFRELVQHFHEEVDGDHGRIETRRSVVVEVCEGLEHQMQAWRGLRSFCRVESTRQCGDEISTEQRYYITTLPADKVAQIAHAARRHWAVENELHWVLDVAFGEDDSRTRIGHAAANLAVVRHVALNLLRREKTFKRGINTKRLRAAWDSDYLEQVLNAPEA